MDLKLFMLILMDSMQNMLKNSIYLENFIKKSKKRIMLTLF